MTNWARMIDSAQRRLILNEVQSPNWPTISRLELEIQGLVIAIGDERRLLSFDQMADYGVQNYAVRPLSIIDRLKRRPAPIADLEPLEGSRVLLRFWTQPQLCLSFDLNVPEEAVLWREFEIMALNGGFHFRVPPELKLITQQK